MPQDSLLFLMPQTQATVSLKLTRRDDWEHSAMCGAGWSWECQAFDAPVMLIFDPTKSLVAGKEALWDYRHISHLTRSRWKTWALGGSAASQMFSEMALVNGENRRGWNRRLFLERLLAWRKPMLIRAVASGVQARRSCPRCLLLSNVPWSNHRIYLKGNKHKQVRWAPFSCNCASCQPVKIKWSPAHLECFEAFTSRPGLLSLWRLPSREWERGHSICNNNHARFSLVKLRWREEKTLFSSCRSRPSLVAWVASKSCHYKVSPISAKTAMECGDHQIKTSLLCPLVMGAEADIRAYERYEVAVENASLFSLSSLVIFWKWR